MSLGVMMAGGTPAITRGREKRDFYPTPGDVTRALLAVESFTGAIWEPACGDDAMADELRTTGCPVVATDLFPLGKGKKLDFLTVPPRKVANIVTRIVGIGENKGKTYDERTARSQAGQMMNLFSTVGIATREKQTLTFIKDSTVAAKLSAIIAA